MKRILVLIYFFLIIDISFCQTFRTPNVNFPTPNTILDIVTQNGKLLLFLDLEFKSGDSTTGYFIVDTGCSTSFLFKSSGLPKRGNDTMFYNLPPPWPEKYALISRATSSTLEITNWDLMIQDIQPPANSNPNEAKIVPIGVLGTDIIYLRSFYLSISKKKIGWPSTPPFTPTLFLPETPIFISRTPTGDDPTIGAIRIPADSTYIGPAQYSGSRYVIDTGSFAINTSYSDFLAQLQNIPRISQLFSMKLDTLPHCGIVTLPSFSIGGNSFEGLFFGGGFLPYAGSFYKVLGAQLLAHFDWWIEIHPELKGFTTSYGTARAALVPEDEYCSFLTGIYPPSTFFFPSTSGFTTDADGRVDRIIFNGDVRIEPQVNINDLLLSYNGVAVPAPFLESFSGGTLLFQRPDRTQYSITPKAVTMDGWKGWTTGNTAPTVGE